MASTLVSGLTLLNNFSVFGEDGLQLADLYEDMKNLGSWFDSLLPSNRFVKTVIYTTGALVLFRSSPFIFRKWEFFLYWERSVYHWHRVANSILPYKKELLKELKDDSHNLPYNKDRLIILEINAGGGTNITYYPDNSVLIATDFMESYKELIEQNFDEGDPGNLSSVSLDRFIHTNPDELQNIPDCSVSAVVCIYALCSSKMVLRALAEIKRVLIPGGKMYFLEHVMEYERFSWNWFWQVNFYPTYLMCQCNPHIHFEKDLEKIGFSEVSLERGRIPGRVFALSATVYGYAVK